MANLYLVKITVISNLGPEGGTCGLGFPGSWDEGARSLIIELIKKVTERQTTLKNEKESKIFLKMVKKNEHEQNDMKMVLKMI